MPRSLRRPSDESGGVQSDRRAKHDVCPPPFRSGHCVTNLKAAGDIPIGDVLAGPPQQMTGPLANRPTNIRFGSDGCAYVVDYGAVRDLGSDTHFAGAANGTLVQIPGTGAI